MARMTIDFADDLLSFIDQSPTPYHAVETVRSRLVAAGFKPLDERDAWKLSAGDKVFVTRGETSLLAFILGEKSPVESGFRMVGAHTDSPNLRLKPKAQTHKQGHSQLAVEPYGGVLWHTWLDRELSIAGRVFFGSAGRPESALIRIHEPLARIPSLAIHLNRGVNSDGLVLNAQQHLPPLVALDSIKPFDVRERISAEVSLSTKRSITANEILSFDLALYDIAPSTRGGANREFIFAPRLDNLASCHAGLTALLRAPAAVAATRGIALYDHEEVGSRSAQGADSPFLKAILERIVESYGATSREAFARAMAQSFFVSADMAHALHPNYADKQEPGHVPYLGQGPVIKSNVNQSYATDGESWAWFEIFCRAAKVTPQYFVTRSDLGCGSTIGPITAAQLGMRTVDVGNPMLSMHSIREMAAASDVGAMIAVQEALFSA